jgi:uncharacterized protein (TIGR03437 family)
MLHRLCVKFGTYLLLAGLLACGSLLRAQASHSIRIVTLPDGALFFVDGQMVRGSTTVVWPVGSKHTLTTSPSQEGPLPNSRFTFISWTIGGVPLNPPAANNITVTSDPGIASIEARFNAEYALILRFFQCSDESCIYSPGTIYAGALSYRWDTDIWVPAGSVLVFQAVPNAGYVFTGWQVGANPLLPTSNFSVTADTPKGVYPRFGVARQVHFDTSPPGMQVVADRNPIPTPNTLEWAWNTDHTVGVISPQQDIAGQWMVFASWSDGGALNHAYHVEPFSVPASVTATFALATAVDVVSSPMGLKLKIDGTDIWPTFRFYWGAGETHHVEAPARLSDADGHNYVFKAWSQGGAPAQDVTVPEGSASTGLRFIATYTPVSNLTVSASLAAAGVTVDGADCPRPCVIERAPGIQVKLAVPASVPLNESTRADFVSWSDGAGGPARVVSLGADRVALVASYRLLNRLSVSSDPPEGAQWRTAPAAADNFFDSASQVAVTMTPRAGYRFRQWDGDLNGASATGVVAMSAPRAVRGLLDRIPYVPPSGVRNAASETPAAGVAPGSVVAIFGANLAPQVTVGPGSPLAQTLDGVTVQLAGRLLPLFFVAPDQINVQIPSGLDPGEYTLIVSRTGQPDVRIQAEILRNAPGLFQDTSGAAPVALAVHENGDPVSAAAPARRGERITVYGTGLGPCDRPRPDGFAVPDDPPFPLTDPVQVSLGGAALAPEAAFATPARVGMDAVVFRIPSDATGGMDLKVRVNGVESNTVALPVE